MIEPRNMDMIVLTDDENTVKEMRYSKTLSSIPVREVQSLFGVFDRAEQMTAFEFNAYTTLGEAQCDAQGINTLEDMFGTEFSDAFYKRKNFLIAQHRLKELYSEKARIEAEIKRWEEKL